MAIRRFNGNDMENVSGGVTRGGIDRFCGACSMWLETEADKEAYAKYLDSIEYTKEDEKRNGMTKEEYVKDTAEIVFSKPGKKVSLISTIDEYEEFKRFVELNPALFPGVHFKR